MTTTQSLDIIIPVWNNPTEARTCLVSILESSTTARLIIVNNGCDRTTELLLEEFSDHLGDRAIYMTMERNIGFVPAVNRALTRSDANWALIVRPATTITPDCISQILQATTVPSVGLITPFCTTAYSQSAHLLKRGCPTMETDLISFSALAVSRTLRQAIGSFDESLDGDIWCLKDYRHRSNAHGFQTLLLPHAVISSSQPMRFGSAERRKKQDAAASSHFLNCWGKQQHVAVYLPKEADESRTAELLQQLLTAARHGHRIELLMHRQQFQSAINAGTACLHSSIRLHKLAMLTPYRSLVSTMLKLTAQHPELQPVCGLDSMPFPGYATALPSDHLQQLTRQHGG